MKKLILLSLIVLELGNFAGASSLSQNDVSVLMPLPKVAELSLMLQPTTTGTSGQLLPRPIFDKLPPIVHSETDPNKIYSVLRVVAARVDPCFPFVPPATGCQPQIRFIWQPVESTLDGSTRARDASLHTFYNLSDAEFKLLISQLEKLKTDSGLTVTDEALTINPALQKTGYSGTYAQGLFRILLSFTGIQKMSRVTFMQLSGGDNLWIFGGFDLISSALKPIIIPRINTVTQLFTNGMIGPGPIPVSFLANLSPAPQGKDTFNLLIRNSSVITPSNKDEIIESTLSAVRAENPLNHSAQTMDCVSCHTAQPARIWATTQFPYVKPLFSQFEFQSKFNLSNTSTHPEKTTLLRGFGYDGANPAISQRVINETAKVLEDL